MPANWNDQGTHYDWLTAAAAAAYGIWPTMLWIFAINWMEYEATTKSTFWTFPSFSWGKNVLIKSQNRTMVVYT